MPIVDATRHKFRRYDVRNELMHPKDFILNPEIKKMNPKQDVRCK